MADSPWHLAGNRAELRLVGNGSSTDAKQLAGMLEVDRPHAGIHIEAALGANLRGVQLFALASQTALAAQELFGDAVEDCYVRGRDLVITYGESPRMPLRYQVYWRVLDDAQLGGTVGGTVGIDLIVSAQTSVLDINPTAFCWSTAAAKQCEQLYDAHGFRPLELGSAAREGHDAVPLDAGAPKCLRIPLGDAAAGLSLAQMIHSTDEPYSHTTVSAGGWPAHERIAIRHSLFRQPLEKGVILRGRLRAVFTRDAMQAATARQNFEASPIPLTV